MKCNHCGSENASDAKYCFQCGKEIAPVEPFKKESMGSQSSDRCCPNCGAKNVVTSNFCKDCGKELSKSDSADGCQPNDGIPSMIPQEESTCTSKSKQCDSNVTRNDTICPYCKEPDCNPMQKSTTEVNTKTYKWGSGCCGMFLLGPFGLLCGMCGTGSKVKTDNELWWVCTKCGKQHIAMEDAVKKYENVVSKLPISGVSIGVGLMIFRIILYWILGTGFIASAVGIIASVILAAVIVFEGFGEFEKEIAAQLGASIEPYLTEEQKSTQSNNQMIALGIAVAIALLGIRVLLAIAE